LFVSRSSEDFEECGQRRVIKSLVSADDDSVTTLTRRGNNSIQLASLAQFCIRFGQFKLKRISGFQVLLIDGEMAMEWGPLLSY
jgi:hypothetical protein